MIHIKHKFVKIKLLQRHASHEKNVFTVFDFFYQFGSIVDE